MLPVQDIQIPQNVLSSEDSSLNVVLNFKLGDVRKLMGLVTRKNFYRLSE